MNATIESLNLSLSALQYNPRHQLLYNLSNSPFSEKLNFANFYKTKRPTTFYCHNSNASKVISPSETEDTDEDDGDDAPTTASPAAMIGVVPPLRRRRRRRYRKQHPGEKNGITEEMRFVAMKLRNSSKPKKSKKRIIDSGGKKEFESGSSNSSGHENGGSVSDKEGEKDNSGNQETWNPSIEGFLKYLVDSELVFSTIERIVDESHDVSCKLPSSSLSCTIAVSMLCLDFFFFFLSLAFL